MIKKTFTLFLMLIAFSINAQKNIDINNIKKSKLHYWGESPFYDTDEKAENKAMEMMCYNIIETIAASPVEIGGVGKEAHLEKIMLTLENEISYKMIVNVVRDTKNDKYSCLAYIAKDDFEAICNERTSEIQRYSDIGKAKEDGDMMVDALRSYYWGMMLCVAHPYGSMLKINVDNEDVPAYEYLHERVVDVLDTFTFAVSKNNPGEFNDEGITVMLNVRSNGNDVSHLRFKYYNGVDDYVTTTATNGKAAVQLANHNVKDFDIKIEYDFSHEKIAYPEIANVLNNIDNIVIKDNVKRYINIEPYTKYFNGEKIVEPSSSNNDKLNGDEKYFLSLMQEIEKAFRAKNYASVKKYFTDESYAMLDTLVKNGNISVVGNQQYEFITYGNTTICRDIDMKFQFRNQASFLREVVFRFDNESKLITSMAFCLSSEVENDIATKNKWNNDCKQALINFLEDYQTAYALKRYDYLESIFSDDTLIIVGHVLKGNNDELKDIKKFNLPAQEVELLRMDKNAYFDRLSKVFKSQEYINIRFTETDFKRQMFSNDESNTNGEDIFGVRLLQEYHSTTYGDVGYLFLMVDLREVQRPVIHVRVWQPDKVDINKLVDLRHFKL